MRVHPTYAVAPTFLELIAPGAEPSADDQSDDEWTWPIGAIAERHFQRSIKWHATELAMPAEQLSELANLRAASARAEAGGLEREVLLAQRPEQPLGRGRHERVQEHGDDAETLIDAADRAMYKAKSAGDNVALGEPAPAAEVADESSNESVSVGSCR